MRTLPYLLGTLTACVVTTGEATPPAYHNPLDLADAGAFAVADGGVPDAGAPASVGTVAGRTPNLAVATYSVLGDDAGLLRTDLIFADVGDLCARAAGDGGLGASWDLLRVHLAGGTAGLYPVAPVLPPGGAIAQFEFRSDAGGFGIVPAVDGGITLSAIDAANQGVAVGSYTLSFSLSDGGSTSLTGRFSATPCAAVPPAPGT